MQIKDKEETNWNKWSSFGTIAAAFFGFFGIFIGWYYSYQNTNFTKEALELTSKQIFIAESQNKRDSSKRSQDSIADKEKSKNDDIKFHDQMKQQEGLANANLEFVKKQTVLMKDQLNLYEKQLKLTESQSEIVQNELKNKSWVAFFKLREMLKDLDDLGLIVYQDSIKFNKEFADKQNRVIILKSIEEKLLRESNNISMINNDTLRNYWLQVYRLTTQELSYYNDNFQINTIITDKGNVNDKTEIDKIYLQGMWEYLKLLRRKLYIFNLVCNSNSENLNTFKVIYKGNTASVKSNYDDDNIIQKYGDAIIRKSRQK